MKKALLVSIALVVMYVVGTFAAGTTVNGARIINGDLTVKGTCTGCGSAAGLVLLEQHTASSSASLDFTTCISSTYDEYQITLINIVPSTDHTIPALRVSSDGGMTWINSGTPYTYFATAVATSGTATSSSSGLNQLQLIYSGGSGDNPSSTASFGGVVGSYELFNPLSATAEKLAFGTAIVGTGSNRIRSAWGGSFVTTGTSVNAFQILIPGDTIASGTVRCYGIAKS